MNWLAHLVLSEPSPTFRVGNLLPDLMRQVELAAMPEVFRRGIECHRCIDAFTDRHPLVRRSVQRIRPPHRRFAPILIDVFYDHFLSIEWAHHYPQPLDQFVQEVYASFDGHRAQLPAATYGHLQRMRAEDWLSSYHDVAGVRVTLERIARRLRRPINLGEGEVELVRNYDALQADFDEFFPELRSHVKARFANPDNPSLVPACQ